MMNWNDLKNLDVKNLDLTKIDLTRLDVRRLDLRQLDVRRLDLAKFDRPELSVDADRVLGLAREAAYAGVGVAVVGVQMFDARRRELTDQLTAQVRKVVDAVA